MVSARLSYNPYILRTEIWFNGHEPRVNSLIEKYQSSALREWVQLVPGIFHDELNGYDFDLDFWGTERDFDELQSAFKRQNIGEDMVRLSHRGVMRDRKSESNSIDSLLAWLQENRNKHFDYDRFMDSYKELFESDYPFIILNGRGINTGSFDQTDISVEQVDDIKELAHISLYNTPIMIYVNEILYKKLHRIIPVLMSRDDIRSEQLFFMVAPAMQQNMVERTIIDLGIAMPQIVSEMESPLIKRYMELYPVSDYIVEALYIIHKEKENMTLVMESEYQHKRELNREVIEKLEKIDEEISNLRKALDLFEHRSKYVIPYEWGEAGEPTMQYIKQWRIRKIKISKEDEAKRAAEEYKDGIDKNYKAFIEKMGKLYNAAQKSMNRDFALWYGQAGDDDFVGGDMTDALEDMPEQPVAIENFLEKRDAKYVPKDSIWVRVSKGRTAGIKEPQEMVLEVTYSLEKWRAVAFDKIDPVYKEIREKYKNAIRGYEKRMVDSYIERLTQRINEANEKKEKTTMQLSEEERKLQRDHEWLKAFSEQLQRIEGGDESE